MPAKESPIFIKLFEFVAWVLPLSTKFPRAQRFVVAEAVQRAALAAHEAAIRAGHSTIPASTLAHLDELALQLALVRFYLRLSFRLTLITVEQYEFAATSLMEIGRLLQGWRKVVTNQQTVTSTTVG